MDIDYVSSSRYISDKIKKEVLERQNYRCANNVNINGYLCLLWKYENGLFDNSGYQFDHIEEYCLSKNNNIENIQALCHNCHAVKTKLFMKHKGYFSSIELSNGMTFMEY